jgi:membrane protease YdiL (CAAX protease family)
LSRVEGEGLRPSPEAAPDRTAVSHLALSTHIHVEATVRQSAVAGTRPGKGRLIAWLVLVGVLAGLAFAANSLVAQQTPTHGYGGQVTRYDDSFYRFSLGVVVIVQDAIILGLVLLIARGLRRRETFALYRPPSWPRTIGLVLGTLVTTYVVVVLLANAIGSGAQPDQGMPLFWDGSRGAQFAFNLVVIAAFVPVVEELTFRGLGFTLLSRFGPAAALVGTAVLFGLVHGFLLALPIFVAFGLALGTLRMRTGSVYPGMLLHGTINTIATILAVTLGP